MKTEGEKREYARGYNAAVKRKWPDHAIPELPQEQYQRVLNAAINIRDQADCFQATIDSEDEWAVILCRLVDDFDKQIELLNDWIQRRCEEATA